MSDNEENEKLKSRLQEVFFVLEGENENQKTFNRHAPDPFRHNQLRGLQRFPIKEHLIVPE